MNTLIKIYIVLTVVLIALSLKYCNKSSNVSYTNTSTSTYDRITYLDKNYKVEKYINDKNFTLIMIKEN